MHKLIHFEFRRLFRRLSLYICLGLVVLSAMYAISVTATSYFNAVENNRNTSYFTAYSMLQSVFSFTNLPIMLAVFTAVFICEDRVNGTAKTIFSLGYSRYQIFLARYLASTTVCVLFYTSVVFLSVFSSLLLGFSFTPDNLQTDMYGYDAGDTDAIKYIVQQFFVFLAVNTFYHMVSELFGKTGISVVMNIFAPLLIYIVLAIFYSILYSIVSGYTNGDQSVLGKLDYIGSRFTMYWLPTLVTSIAGLFGAGHPDFLISILINCFYVVLFGGIAMLLTVKKQIKN